MFQCNEPPAALKTLILSAVSLLSDLGLRPVDKSILGRIIVYIGQTILTDFTFNELETVLQQDASDKISKLEKEISQLSGELENLKRELREH